MKEVKKMENKEKNVFLWGILSFFVPIVGLVLYLAWKKEKPKTAKSSLIGGIIGIIGITMLIVVAILCLSAFVFGNEVELALIVMYIFSLIVRI